MYIFSFRNHIKVLCLWICACVAFVLNKKSTPAILMYHSFDTQGWKHGVSPASLRKQIQYLHKKKKVVPLTDVVSYAKGDKQIVHTSVAVTVDDGYEDTYSVLFPLAKEYNIPFTIFLTTDLSVQSKLGNLARPSWSQLKEMIDSGLVEVQLHGHTHNNFPDVVKADLHAIEIEGSKEIIETQLGTTVDTVAYPAGVYDQKTIDYLKSKKYTAALSTHMGMVNVGDNLYVLRRVLVDRATSYSLFKLRLSAGLPIYLYIINHLKKSIHAISSRKNSSM